jgi:proteasome accessory factor C
VLAIVPYVLAHPGTTIADLANRFRVTAREIERDLELLPLCGLPPYTADRLIDVWIADDGGVDIRLAEYFERPLRLTPAEGVAVIAAARALLAVPGSETDGPLATAVEKLEAVVGASGRLAIDVGNTAHLPMLRKAIERHERVEIDYYSYSRDEMTTRAVDPERVFHAFGAWYLAAYCHRAGSDRLFRVDRIQAVRHTEQHFDPRPHGGQPRPTDDGATDPSGLVYHPRPGDRRVTLRLAPRVAWVAEDFPVEERHDEAGGSVRVVLRVSGDAFLERLLLRLGPDAEILEPADVVRQRAAAAARVLQRYR